jgi:hypothetical protein
MATNLKKTSVAGRVPNTFTLSVDGDIGINTYDGRLWVSNGSVVSEIGAGSGTPGGSNTQIQFNDSDVFGGNANLTYNKTTSVLTVNGTISATNLVSTGDVTAFFSDDRLKERKNNIENALDKVESLNGFYYIPNELAQELGYEPTLQVGVSAQEVQKILPEVVVPAPIDEQYLTVKYEKLVPLLIEAIKELKEKLNRIENKSE